MPLRYLIDENLRGTLAIALVRVATRHGLSLDVMQIGDEPAPSLSTQDPELLIWTEKENRLLISRDRRTLAAHLAAHLARGHQSPGIVYSQSPYDPAKDLEDDNLRAELIEIYGPAYIDARLKSTSMYGTRTSAGRSKLAVELQIAVTKLLLRLRGGLFEDETSGSAQIVYVGREPANVNW
jgi:hypothetical protein